MLRTRETVLDAGRFLRWPVAVRTMATVLRWIPHVRDHLRGELSAEEIERAEKMWMKKVQKAFYPHELSDLESGKQVHKLSRIYSLSLILKDGLICVDTILSQCPHLSGVAMFPPFLPSGHPYMELLIEHLHRQMGHQAQEAVVIELSMKCWVPRARQAIRRRKNQYRMCRTLKGKPESDEEAMTLKYRTARGRNVTIGLIVP